MKNLQDGMRLLCVRIAEHAGWLFEVRSGIVSSYLSSRQSSLPDYPTLNFPKLTLVTLAATSVAALCVIASFPALQIGDILQSREEQAAVQYRELIQIQGIVENRPDALAAESRRSLLEARIQLAELVLQLEELRSKTGETNNSKVPVAALKLRSILEAVKINLSEGQTEAVATPARNITVASQLAISSDYAARINLLLERAKTEIRNLPHAVYAYSSKYGRRSITLEQLLSRSPNFPKLDVEEEETRLPPKYNNWNGFIADNGKPYEPSEVLKGDYMRGIPGGIAFASTATFDGKIDLSAFILTYDRKNQRLALVGPNSQIYYSQPIEPQTLKTLNAFILSGQTNAVSVGWSGQERTSRSASQIVLLDPTLVDTRVGQDLVLADSIPWEFSRPFLAQWPNPIAVEFANAFDRVEIENIGELAAYLNSHRPNPSRWQALIAEVKADENAYDAKLASCSMEPEFVHLVTLVLQSNYPKLSLPSVLQVIDEEVLKRTTLGTLYDKSPSFSLQSEKLDLRSGIEYRYVTSRIEYGDQIKFGKCLHGPDVRHLSALDNIVNMHVNDIVANIPAIKDTREYASIVAFLRWARQPGHLQGVDFYSLLAIEQHDEAQTPTPDLIRR